MIFLQQNQEITTKLSRAKLSPLAQMYIFFSKEKTPMKKSICRGLMYDYFKPIGESSDKYIRSLLNVMMVSKNIYYVR